MFFVVVVVFDGRGFYQEGGPRLTALRWEVARVKGHHSEQMLHSRRGGYRKGADMLVTGVLRRTLATFP